MEIDLIKLTPNIRKLSDMKEVIADQTWAANALDVDLYYMYRGVAQENGLRYDITVIPARMLGNEFSKTKGHVHIGNYQEVYTVLEGQAIYLMQKTEHENVQDVYAVKCDKGDTIIIPSGYGHMTINPSSTQELKMANWISPDCKSDYSLFEKLQGACYYYTTEGWINNKHYKNTPPLRSEEPIKEIPKDLNFLRAS